MLTELPCCHLKILDCWSNPLDVVIDLDSAHIMVDSQHVIVQFKKTKLKLGQHYGQYSQLLTQVPKDVRLELMHALPIGSTDCTQQSNWSCQTLKATNSKNLYNGNTVDFSHIAFVK